MDTLRFIGAQRGIEGNEFRDFIQALTPEKAVALQQWASVAEGMPDDVETAWKVIGWRIADGVEKGHSRRWLMRDIGKVLDQTVYSNE